MVAVLAIGDTVVVAPALAVIVTGTAEPAG